MPSHPITLTLPPDQLAAQFIRITQESLPDSNWHFAIALPKTAQRGNQPAAVPAADGQLVSLGFFHLPQPAADIEIYGAHLTHEIDPADFLDLWIEKTGLTTLSAKRIPTLGGILGDTLVSWPADGTFLGRCFCLKFGPRLILVWCRCAVADYESLAQTFFLALSDFKLMTDPFGPLAQNVHWVSNTIPTTWKLALPQNWTVQSDPPVTRISSFQALWKSNEIPLAKLFCTIAPPDLVTDATSAFSRIYQASTESGITLKTTQTAPETPTEGLLGSWYSLTAAEANGQPVELRCRVQKRPQLWLITAVLCPPRSAPAVWMHAKRTLDIAAATLLVT